MGCVCVMKFEFEGGTHFVRFWIHLLCAIAADNFSARKSSNLLWLIENTSFEFFRLTLLAQIISCGPWEKISITNMHIHGFGKWTSFFIMSIKLVLFRIITNVFLINLIILFSYCLFCSFNLAVLAPFILKF